MLTTIIGPHPDEMLQSVVANALERLFVADRKGMGSVLTGVYGAHLRGEFPSNLGHAADVLGRRLGLDVDEMISRTTFVPLYAPFIGRARLAMLRKAMIDGGRVTASAIVGFHANPTPLPRFLRFCATCQRRDIRKRQLSWWRRTHQVAGVEVCPTCGTSLVASQFVRNGAWKADYPVAHLACARFSMPEPTEFSRSIAADVQWLLGSGVTPMDAGSLLAAYHELLERRGFIAHDRLKRTDFLAEFSRAHDRRVLRRLGLSFDVSSPYSWPAKLVVGAGVCHPPLRHIALAHFLGTNAKGLVELARSMAPRSRGRRGPTPSELTSLRALWADQSCSLNEIGRRLGIHWHTVRGWATSAGLELPRFCSREGRAMFRKKRAQMRSTFIQARRTGEPSRPCVKWLGRNDAAWLRCRSSIRTDVRLRVDWRRRDEVLARSADRAARRIRALRPFRRVGALSIADELRCRSAVERHPERMPRFMRCISALREDSRMYALRRIASVQRERPGLPPWRVREVAGISGPLMEDRAILRAMRYCPRFNHGNKPSAS